MHKHLDMILIIRAPLEILGIFGRRGEEGRCFSPSSTHLNPKTERGKKLGALCPSKSGLMSKHIVKHIVGENVAKMLGCEYCRVW
jgi:hypothetical protein